MIARYNLIFLTQIGLIMKTILHFTFLLFLAFGAQAQEISMTPEIFSYEISDGGDVKIGYTITNTRDTDLAWYWIVTPADDFPEDWSIQVCDQVLCWAPNTLQRPVGGEDNILVPGESTNTIFQYIQVNSNGVEGVGEVKFCIYDNTDFNEPIVCSSFSTSTVDAGKIESVNIYPNPAADYFQLTDAAGVAQIDLYNIVGSKVASYTYDDHKAYDISTLRNGLYVARLLSKEGRLLKSLRLSKRP